jgi:large-conductance mechanosensitive channel
MNEPQKLEATENQDGTIRIVQPPSAKHRKGVTVLLESDDLVRGQFGGFVNFLQDYAVVGLALGFIVGQQANGVVKQFVTSFLDPLTVVWFGQNLSARTAILHHNQQIVKVPWGAFVYTLIEFFFVLIAMYAIIKLFKLDHFVAKPKKKK